MDLAARLEVVEKENDILRERLAAVEKILFASGFSSVPIEWRLTGSEARIFGTLMSRDLASKETLMTALYYGRLDDDPDIKIVDLFICKLRKKLKPFGIPIETVWGNGYRLSAQTKSAFRALSASTQEILRSAS